MTLLLNGRMIPHLIYGTAVRNTTKKPNVLQALKLGYRAIDTASTRKFHNESEDGLGLEKFLLEDENYSLRQEIIVQSKYTPAVSQAEPWPYEIEDDTTTQVLKSVLRSANELKVDIIDVYFLQTPLNTFRDTLEAWIALEQIVDRGGIRHLGISNVGITRLRHLFDHARVKPRVVQNWFRKANGYDRDVMRFCKEQGIVYQIYGVFDEGNNDLLACEPVRRRAVHKSISTHQALLQLLIGASTARGLQLCILDGTTNPEHMKGNLLAVARLGDFCQPDLESLLGLIGWS